jgi:hypothetical protein
VGVAETCVPAGHAVTFGGSTPPDFVGGVSRPVNPVGRIRCLVHTRRERYRADQMLRGIVVAGYEDRRIEVRESRLNEQVTQ